MNMTRPSEITPSSVSAHRRRWIMGGLAVALAGASLLSASLLLPRPTFGAVGNSASQGIGCGIQLADLVPVTLASPALIESLRDAIGASLHARIDAASLPADADEIAALAAEFVAARCFGTGEIYCASRLQGGAIASTAAIDEYATGELADARAALSSGELARNIADALLAKVGSSEPVVDCAAGTMSEPGVLGAGSDSAFGVGFWHTKSVASGVRVLCLPEEIAGSRFDASVATVSIGVALRFADGARATVHLAIARAPDTERLAVVGYWRFAPCGELVPDGLNLAY